MTSYPTPPSTDGDSGSDVSTEYSDLGYYHRCPRYPYTPREIGAKLLSFYRYLTTLYIDPADLHVPPDEGWPDFPEAEFEGFHTPQVREYLRHMPYISGTYQAYTMSYFYDYRGIGSEQIGPGGRVLGEMIDYRQDPEWQNPFDRDEEGGWQVMLYLTYPNGSDDTRWHALDVLRGLIHEQRVRMDYRYIDIDEFLDLWRQELDDLVNIPMPYPYGSLWAGYSHQLKEEDKGLHVTLEEALADDSSRGKVCPRYIQQMYRAHGWGTPGQFRREEAFAAVREFIGKRTERDEEQNARDENSRYSAWSDLMRY